MRKLKNSQFVQVYKLFGEIPFSSLFLVYFEIFFHIIVTVALEMD